MRENPKIAELVTRLVQGTTYEMLDAAQAFAAHGTDGVAAVAPLLRSPERETRWRAAVALERIGVPALEVLIAGARDPDYLVRVPAIWALEHVGDRRSITALVENLNGRNECCRWMAAAALRRVGGIAEAAAVDAAFANDPAGLSIVDELMAGS